MEICGGSGVQPMLRLNGAKVGQRELTPAWTGDRKSILYDIYGVTSMLNRGANTMGVLPGNGMFNLVRSKGRYSKFSGSFVSPRPAAELDRHFHDGTRRTILTGPQRQTASRPILDSSTCGVNVCTVLSAMSERLPPSAHEVEAAGEVGMHAPQSAGGRPSRLVDWKNNHGGDPDKSVFFHRGDWAKEFLPDIRITTSPILGATLGEENTFGTLDSPTDTGTMTFGGVSTNDRAGKILAYVGEGEFPTDPLETFGLRAVVKVPDLPRLMHIICLNGFEHHAAMNRSHCVASVAEALSRYPGWEIYRRHRPAELPPTGPAGMVLG